MARYLKVKFPNKCIGCDLCTLEAQRQLKKIGLEGAPIRILKTKKENNGYLEYSIDIDPRINDLNIEKIKKICPTGVFEIMEEEQNGLTG